MLALTGYSKQSIPYLACMKNILIAGASGMIGGLILSHCLHSEEVAGVTVIVRKSLGLSHPKLTEVVHRDFTDYTAITSVFKGVDVCYYCVGVYTGQVPTDEFKKITVDYTCAFASILKQQSPETVFCFLSGDGADPKEKSRLLFAREKGKAENFLLSLSFGATYIFRPGYIYPVQKREEPNRMYAVLRVLWKPFFSRVAPWSGVTSVQLAQVMTQVGLHGAAQTVFSNNDIRRFPVR